MLQNFFFRKIVFKVLRAVSFELKFPHRFAYCSLEYLLQQVNKSVSIDCQVSLKSQNEYQNVNKNYENS